MSSEAATLEEETKYCAKRVTFNTENLQITGRKGNGRSRVVQISLIIAVLATVWVFYGLPVVILSILKTKEEENIQPKEQPQVLDLSQYCKQPLNYTGQICRSELLQRQRCLSERLDQQAKEEVVHISSNTNQTEVENAAEILIFGFLLLNPSKECDAAFRSFFCMHMFSLCSGGKELEVSQEECVDVSSRTCAREWEIALSYLDNDILPTCFELPNKTMTCTTNDLPRSGQGKETNCSLGFYFRAGTCLPQCGEFIPSTSRSTAGVVVITMTALAAICILCTSVVTTLSCTIQRHSMMKFPFFLIVLLCITDSALALGILIGSTDRKLLFCSYNKDLININSKNEETSFCTLTGLLFIYCLVQWNFLNVMYSVTICWTKISPKSYHKARNIGREKYCSLLSILLVIFLPLIFSIGHLRHGFVIGHFPTFFCSPRDITYDFITVFIIPYITSAVTISGTILCLWTMFKERISTKKKKTKINELESFLWFGLILIYTVFSDITNLAYHSTAMSESTTTHSDTDLSLCKNMKTQESIKECEVLLGGHSRNTARLVFVILLMFQPLVILVMLASSKMYRYRRNALSLVKGESR